MLMPEVQQRARHRLLVFGGFNSASFTLLTGNLISLYLIRLGADNTLLGVVAAIEYIAFFFLLVGKQFVPRVGVMRVFAWAWLIRYIAVIPMLLAPVVIAPPLGPTAAFALVVIGALGFHAARGVGIVANAPMFSGFAEQDGRGRLLSQFQMIFAVVGIAGGAAVAWLLGPEASLGAYVLFLSTGVALGFVATAIVFSLPELDAASRSARTSTVPRPRHSPTVYCRPNYAASALTVSRDARPFARHRVAFRYQSAVGCRSRRRHARSGDKHRRQREGESGRKAG